MIKKTFLIILIFTIICSLNFAVFAVNDINMNLNTSNSTRNSTNNSARNTTNNQVNNNINTLINYFQYKF